jgi:hypothetical protein
LAQYFSGFFLRFLTKRVRGGYENEKVGVSKYFETGGFTNILPHGKKRMSVTVQNTSKLAFYFCIFFSQIFYPTVISEWVIVFLSSNSSIFQLYRGENKYSMRYR